MSDFPGDKKAVTLHACGAKARRQEVYVEQGVIFKGSGWAGRSSIPPPPPSPPETSKNTPEEHFERLDSYAEKQYKHDTNVRPYVREEVERRRREVRGVEETS